MNAKFGIILRKAILPSVLTQSTPTWRYWGDELVEVGEKVYTSQLIEGVTFHLYPITEFVRDHLPADFRKEELEYASMTGEAIDAYEEWLAVTNCSIDELHTIEKGLLQLIEQVGGVAIMIAPEGDRVNEFIIGEHVELIAKIRYTIKNLIDSDGFLVTINC